MRHASAGATAVFIVVALWVGALAPAVEAAPYSPLWRRDAGDHLTRSIDSKGHIDMDYLGAKDLLKTLSRHKQNRPTEREELHDPRWRFGQWGLYGGRTASELQWSHRPLRDIGSERSVGQWDPTAPRDLQREEDEEVHHWAIPSPLTPSGIPPIVVHIPMTTEEQRAYDHGIEEESARRMRTLLLEVEDPGEEDPEEDHRIRPAEHPLPEAYKMRVLEVAEAAGFEWAGLAVPSVVPDQHLFRAEPRLVESLLLESENEVRGEVRARDAYETRRHNKKHRTRGEGEAHEESIPDPADLMPPTDPLFAEDPLKASFAGLGGEKDDEEEGDEESGTYVDEAMRAGPSRRHRDAEGRLDATEVEWARIEHRRDRDLLRHENPDRYYRGAAGGLRPDAERFARLMRRRNQLRAQRREWQAAWGDWEQRAVKRANITERDVRSGEAQDHTTRDADGRGWEARLAMARKLRRRLLEEQGAHVRAAVPQHPEARVTRDPTCLGRQPTMWTAYRERWDAPTEDKRPARWIQHGRRFNVGDPMLTEQWSVYDAEARGDLPPGVYPTRPSISAGPVIWDDMELDGSGVGVGVVDSGIELSHPELVHRYTRATSYDALNPRRNRPPTPVDPWIETHGTQAAGVAVAQRDNGHCGSGLAPGARLGAIRLLGLRSPTDAEEAAAISHACRPHGAHPSQTALINSVFSCSWGPVDDGGDLRGPGRLAQAAMDRCVHSVGRRGLGSIYVWAGGNGRSRGDNVNFDGYANRPETIAVGALDDGGNQAWYSEPGAALVLVAPSSGGTNGVITSDPSGPAGLSAGRCTRMFGGTSAAAPAVAGVVALMLQADPGMGWRDIQHILVRSSEQVAHYDRREPWSLNGAGLWHSHGYGFGLLNATKAVLLTMGWNPLSPREPLVYRSPTLGASDTWIDMHSGEDAGGPGWRGEEEGGRVRSIDTASYDPETGHHLHRVAGRGGATHRTDGPALHDAEALEKEALEGAATLPQKPSANESLSLSALLFAPRYLAYKTRQFRDAIMAVAHRERVALRDARREVAPNAVRSLRERAGIAIPPGHSAYFEWEYPTGEDAIGALEHVGLSVQIETPAGRGLMRIWLCAPSGTCSLMAPAPRDNDRHGGISGVDWTFWSVRHWGEQPRYEEDMTGHGPGTWSLRLTHTAHWVAEKAEKFRIERRRHPDRTDAIVHWWALEFRGSAEAPPL